MKRETITVDYFCRDNTALASVLIRGKSEAIVVFHWQCGAAEQRLLM